jgi:hypothetical protein
MNDPNQATPLTEEEAEDKAASEFGGIHGRLALAESRETKRIAKAAAALSKQYPDVPAQEIQMWAEVRDTHSGATLKEAKSLTKGRNTSKRLEMTPALKAHIEEARLKVKAALEEQKAQEEAKKPQRIEDLIKGKSPEEVKEIRTQAKRNYIINGLRGALEDNDSFHAYVFMEEAISLGIDLTDLIKNTKTELDPEAMKKELQTEMLKGADERKIVVDDIPLAIGGA